MSHKSDLASSSLADVLERMAEKEYAFNFDFTLEFNTPGLRVGSMRVHGRVESAPPRKK